MDWYSKRASCQIISGGILRLGGILLLSSVAFRFATRDDLLFDFALRFDMGPFTCVRYILDNHR